MKKMADTVKKRGESVFLIKRDRDIKLGCEVFIFAPHKWLNCIKLQALLGLFNQTYDYAQYHGSVASLDVAIAVDVRHGFLLLCKFDQTD